MARATPHSFLPSSRHKPAFSCGSPQDSRSAAAGLCSRTFQGGGGRLPVAQHRRSALDDGSAASSSPAAAAAATDPETVRLVTAATILSASPGSSGSGDAAAHAAAGLAAQSSSGDADADADADAEADPLLLLEELAELDADSLSLVVGILRQRQPTLEADEAGVELSERLRDFLLLLKQRPSKLISAAAAGGSGAAAAPAATSSSSSASSSEAALAEGFWAGPENEWQDVRCALMSIGINATVDDDDDDEEEGVWAQEEDGGPAVRRTRLLQRLPKLDAATAAELSAFLAEAQQRSGQAALTATAVSGGSGTSGGGNGRTAAADRPQQAEGVSEDEERWWGNVTAAYRLLWQQARAQQLQQRPPATEASG